MVAGVVASFVFLSALAVGGIAWLHGEAGRGWLARKIENAVNEGIRGRLRIGRIHRLRGFSVVASDVVFADPRGHDVIAIGDARLGIRPFDLLLGKVRLRDAAARGVVVRVVPGVRKSTSLEDAFEGHGGGGPGGTDLDTDTIVVSEARVRIAMGGPPVMLNALHGMVRVVLPKGGLVRVKFDRFHGRFNLPSFELFQGRSFRTVGWVHAGANPVVEFRLRACLPTGTMPMRVRYSPRRLMLRFDADETRFAGALVGLVATFSPTIHSTRGRVSMAGVDGC